MRQRLYERVPLRTSNPLEEDFVAIRSYAYIEHEGPVPVGGRNFDSMIAYAAIASHAKDERALYYAICTRVNGDDKGKT